MKSMKRAIAMCAAVAILCTASITAIAADGASPETTIPSNDGFVCQVTGGVCTLDHEHGTGLRLGAQDGTGAGLCCTLDHEHTDDCILPRGICALDHEHNGNCVLSSGGTGCGMGRRNGSGGGHHGGRGRHCS